MIQGFFILEVRCIRQLFKEVLQVPFRVQIICFGGFDQTVYDGAGFGSFGAVAEQPVLSSDREGTDAVFCGVVGDVAVPVFEIVGQFNAVRQEVVHRRC